MCLTSNLHSLFTRGHQSACKNVIMQMFTGRKLKKQNLSPGPDMGTLKWLPRNATNCCYSVCVVYRAQADGLRTETQPECAPQPTLRGLFLLRVVQARVRACRPGRHGGAWSQLVLLYMVESCHWGILRNTRDLIPFHRAEAIVYCEPPEVGWGGGGRGKKQPAGA